MKEEWNRLDGKIWDKEKNFGGEKIKMLSSTRALFGLKECIKTKNKGKVGKKKLQFLYSAPVGEALPGNLFSKEVIPEKE